MDGLRQKLVSPVSPAGHFTGLSQTVQIIQSVFASGLCCFAVLQKLVGGLEGKISQSLAGGF